MKLNQNYIDNLAADDFINMLNNDNNYNFDILEDKREIIQYDNDDKFYVKFNYKIKISKKYIFHTSIIIVTKEIIDKLFFKTLDDAEFYCENARHPSITIRCCDEYRFWVRLFFNDNISCKFDGMNIHFDAAYNIKKKKLFFGKYKTNDFNNESLKKALSDIAEKYGIILTDNYKVIKTNNINDILSQKANAIDIIKNNFNKNKDVFSNVILDEIGRTKDYLDFLIKIAQ